MIGRIKAFFGKVDGEPPAAHGAAEPRDRFEDLQVAAAALLVEAAEMDSYFLEEERSRIHDLARARFDLSDAEAESLIELARDKVARANDLHGFTRVVKERFTHEERVELMEMLWEVGYADGELDHLEASLMRRVAGLLFVSDRESGEARKRAMKKLGLER